MMYIIDPITKEKIIVKDLESSIKSAENFVDVIPNSRYQKERKTYWKNVLNQLLSLSAVDIEVVKPIILCV